MHIASSLNKRDLVNTILSEFYDVFQHFNSGGIYDIVYETGTSLAVEVLAFDNVNLKTWSRYLERLDEKFIERSGTCVNIHISVQTSKTNIYTFLIMLSPL